jgi:hypothetical protein
MICRSRALGPAVLAACAVLAAASAGLFAEVPPEVRAKAAALFDALARIEIESERPTRAAEMPAARRPEPGSRRLTFSEAELNAYTACRLEKELYVRSAVLRLLEGDKVEGRIGIDLGKPQASGLVPQKQDLLFSAHFETKEGKIRIDMDSLYLGTQELSPAFIDVIISVVSALQGVKSTSLKDWYALPKGVLRLETRPGQVVVIY